MIYVKIDYHLCKALEQKIREIPRRGHGPDANLPAPKSCGMGVGPSAFGFGKGFGGWPPPGEKNSLKYCNLVRKMEQKRFLPTRSVNHQTSGMGGRLPVPAEAQGERGP